MAHSLGIRFTRSVHAAYERDDPHSDMAKENQKLTADTGFHEHVGLVLFLAWVAAATSKLRLFAPVAGAGSRPLRFLPVAAGRQDRVRWLTPFC
jgi:hypothetical protein